MTDDIGKELEDKSLTTQPGKFQLHRRSGYNILHWGFQAAPSIKNIASVPTACELAKKTGFYRSKYV